MKNFFGKSKHTILLFLIISIYFIIISYFTILRHQNYYSGRYDLGNMEQTIFNTTKGRIFEMTDPEGFKNISRLKYHADFFLILLSPIYSIFPYAETLLVLQTLVLALGAVPVFLLCREITKNKALSLVVSLGYLLYPALIQSNFFDFHAVKFATTFLLFAFFYLYKRRYFLFGLFCLLAVLCKEQIPIIIFLLSLYGVYKDRKFLKPGLIFAFFNLLYFYIIFFQIIPGFQENNLHFVFKYFSNDGQKESLIAFLLNNLLDKQNLLLLWQLFLPLGFIPLLSPGFLIFALPDYLPKIFSDNPAYKSINYQYTNPITPFIFIALIFGIRKLYKLNYNKKIIVYCISFVILLFSLISFFLYSPFAKGQYNAVKNIFIVKPEIDSIEKFKNTIKESDKLCLTNNLGSHFAKREYLYSFPNNKEEADYILILKGEASMVSNKTADKIISQMSGSKDYAQLIQIKNLYVFKRLWQKE